MYICLDTDVLLVRRGTSMFEPAVVVTGVARHSLGEAFVRIYCGLMPEAQVIGIDQSANPELRSLQTFSQVVFDLNPLRRPSGLKEFATDFSKTLAETVAAIGSEGIGCLVQCAGVYDFGRFIDHDASRRERVLGLNVLGTTEVLHAVMSLNELRRIQNSERFTNVLVSSFQGLHARADRPVYAPSKAYGIDLCTSLSAGQEVAKCICVVPSSIDTPMLHRNHWVTKSGGSEDFFNKMLDGPRGRYCSIFVDGDEAALDEAASEEPVGTTSGFRGIMRKYVAARLAAQSAPLGILSAEACASALAEIVISSQSDSGVYVLTPASGATKAAVKKVPFSSLDRRGILM